MRMIKCVFLKEKLNTIDTVYEKTFYLSQDQFFFYVNLNWQNLIGLAELANFILPTDLLTFSNVYGQPNSLKYGIRCGHVCTAKSLNSIEHLASEVFGFPTSLNSLSTSYLTHRTIYSPFS